MGSQDPLPRFVGFDFTDTFKDFHTNVALRRLNELHFGIMRQSRRIDQPYLCDWRSPPNVGAKPVTLYSTR